MPLNANFIADFSSFLDATKAATSATQTFEAEAAKAGPALDASLQQAGAAADTAGEKLVKMGQGMNLKAIGDQLKTVASDVTSFVSGFVAEYAEAEAATSRMTAALVASGQTAPEVAAAYGEMASKLQEFSGFTDEAISGAQTILITMGQVKPENMEATLTATLELARGMGMELEPAVKMVAKAASSGGDDLGKLKAILGDTVPKGADFAEVMQAINDKFGGQNAAYMQTTAGHMDHMKNTMSDINENVGKQFSDLLGTVFGWFQKLPDGVQTFIVAAVGIGTALAPVLISISSLVGLLSGTAVGTALSTFFTWFLTVIGPAGWLVLALVAVYEAWKHWDDIVAIVQNLYQGIKTWMVDKLGAIFTWVGDKIKWVAGMFGWLNDEVVQHSHVPDMINGIQREFSRLDEVMVAPTIKSLNLINDKFVEFSKLGGFGIERNLADAFDVVMQGGMPTLVRRGVDQTPWGAAGSGVAPTPANVTINMQGMVGTDDPQTRAMLRDAVSEALMSGMRGSRLMGTA